MNKIICEQLKVPEKEFNEGTKAWYDAIFWVDTLYTKYDMMHGIKDLFFSLVKNGAATSVNEERILFVEKVLKMEGLKPIKENVK
ncbi:hypothetical protein NSQ62_08215 [Solibacillus sp. FSL H8-0523]|uniref:hypothetical protein n=1 Tax=Solibacillus sp. FSL H8-0523 TaxID=2954511 RepID=UPI0031015934